jgi:hypothetical protein
MAVIWYTVKIFIVLCVCSCTHCNEEDVIEYLQSLKRSCEEAERLWTSMDINLIEFLHRKLQDHLNVLVYIVASCTDSDELSEMLETLYNCVLNIFRHYSSVLERQEQQNERYFYPPVERTGGRGQPR